MENKTILAPKLVSEIKGTFWVPSYQRGYRWGAEEVLQLLTDIEEYLIKGKSNDDYYLQPIVVKKLDVDNKYELIDGQQRLTTIKLIYKALNDKMPGIFDSCRFNIEYETREETESFLKDPMNLQLAKQNVDFSYINKAYISIKNWLEESSRNKAAWLMKFYPYLEDHLRIIWYEIPCQQDTISLFTRLNIGRIPLTNAELVRAIIFRGNTDHRKIEWAFRWGIIEEQLQNNEFWGFLTNISSDNYPNRIELIFDIISRKEKEQNPIDSFTFNHFYNRINSGENTQENLWQEIWDTYNLLFDWFSDRVLYHKVGFLVAAGYSLVDIKDHHFNVNKQPCNKKAFSSLLDNLITQTLNLKQEELTSLAFNKSREKEKISKVLLLFNVITTMRLENETQRFPFQLHKGKDWSLEHIHAQQDAGLKKEKDWNDWARMYKDSLEAIVTNPISFFEERDVETKKEIALLLLDELKNKLAKGLNRDDYNDLAAKVGDFFNEYSEEDSLHSLANIALLSIKDNAIFNNAPFPVKRKRMLELDKDGSYIPLCTRRVFLKYYTEENMTQFFRWTDDDKESYIKALETSLEPFLL